VKIVCPYCNRRAFAVYSRANDSGSFVRLGNYLDCPFDGMLFIPTAYTIRMTGPGGVPSKPRPHGGYIRLLPDEARPSSVPDRLLKKRLDR